MPEYLAPGVYIEERPGQRSIEGVSTSTTAFVGMTERGPVVGPPVLVTSFGDFQRAFGGYIDITPDTGDLGEHGHLPFAVKQYFDNGGQIAFISRAYKPHLAALGTQDFRMVQLATGSIGRLTATAPKGSSYALINTTRGYQAASKIARDASSLATAFVTISDVVGATLKADFAPALTEDYRSDTAVVQLAAATAAASAKLVAQEPGVWAENISVSIQPASSAPVATTTNIGAVTSVPVTSAAGFYVGCAIEIHDVDANGHVSNYRYATVTAITGNILTIAQALPAAVGGAAGTWVALAEVSVVVSWGTTTERFTGSWWLATTANKLASWSAADVNTFNVDHSVWTILNQNSTLVRLDTTVAPPYDPTNPLASHPTTMDGAPAFLGPDGGLAANTPDALPGYPEYVGNPGSGPGARSGLAALLDELSIALVAIPGITGVSVQGALITHAENEKYRFAVIDAPHNADIAAVRSHRAHYDSEYAALYWPWIQIAHPLTGNLIEVPPSGSVLGIYAGTDVTRGVFKAPANVVVANATDLHTRATMGDQEVLNPDGINVIRDFRPNNRGIRVWGARTISSDPEWIYVNVRRLFIFLEHSIDNGTQWVVFEPNNQALWGRVKRTIETFLETQWRQGALFGAKAEDAYYVKCDRSTMSLDDIANGRLIVEIGIAPTRPAEFVIFRIGQFTADASSN
jgi:phage tail sheath protein FI